MNYNLIEFDPVCQIRRYYFSHKGIIISQHRLDGPAAEYTNKECGAYYIMGALIGFYPEDKELYEKAVEKYIKKKVFE